MMTSYIRWLESREDRNFSDYSSLWKWSVKELDKFWPSISEFFSVEMNGRYSRVLSSYSMPGVRWFEGAELNYVDYVLRNHGREGVAAVSRSECRNRTELGWNELIDSTRRIASALHETGVRKGDRVAAYLPNISETVIAFLATAHRGAIWSSCSPDFGAQSVIDRFRQIEPKVLFTVDGYSYGGKRIDRINLVEKIVSEIPSIRKVILLPYLNRDASLNRAILWNDFLRSGRNNVSGFDPVKVEFNHPLWILYTSGTTGLPKPIVQSHGGILLEHLKTHFLHFDLSDRSRFFWLTTTGWMMWNVVVSGLLTSSRIILYDGSASYPDMRALWELAEEERVTLFGVGAAYIGACIKSGLTPSELYDFDEMVSIASTGGPLTPEGFEWIYNNVNRDIWVASVSGGTDVCSGFALGCPLLPVVSGRIQCRALGAMVEAYNEKGEGVIGEVGELVLTKPLPSMPLYFWNDPEMKRYRESYFDVFPGVWRHGDWVKIFPDGSLIIYGRSDSTLKRKGIRIGTSEIYRVVEGMDEITDSLVFGVEAGEDDYFVPLFVVLKEGKVLDGGLRDRIRDRIRTELSPRHVPDEVFAVHEIPRTLNGKKLEVPLKRMLLGARPDKAVNLGSVSNPDALWEVFEIAKRSLENRHQPPRK